MGPRAVPRLACAGSVAGVLLLVGCAPSGGQAPPTASPLPLSQLQQRYLRAAASYDTAEQSVPQAESQYCTTTSATADLTRCESALSADRQATIAFDQAVRSITFPSSARGVVTQLLTDDSQLENLLEQAATAPSLSVIGSLQTQIIQLLMTTANDAVAVRTAIGLSASSTPAA
jgi:hypothetical protein